LDLGGIEDCGTSGRRRLILPGSLDTRIVGEEPPLLGVRASSVDFAQRLVASLNRLPTRGSEP
jgi:hypothetical protein